MKKSKRLIVLFLVLIVFGGTVVYFISSDRTTQAGKENKPTADSTYEKTVHIDENFYSEDRWDAEENDKPAQYVVNSECIEMIQKNNTRLAAVYGDFDVEYDHSFSEYPSDSLQFADYLFSVDYYFDDSGFGFVQYRRISAKDFRYSFKWYTSDYAKTWELSPDYHLGFIPDTTEVFDNKVLVATTDSQGMLHGLCHSSDSGKTFTAVSVFDIENQLKNHLDLSGDLFSGQIRVKILSVNETKEYVLLALWDEDTDLYCFIGKFDFDMNFIESVHINNKL